MKSFSPVASGFLLFALSASVVPTYGWAATETSPAKKKFEQALEQTENLHLPLNRAYLYRQAAGAVSQRDKAEAVVLLTRALSEIDAAEVAVRAEDAVDDGLLRQLEMGRRSTILQMLRIDSAEAMRMLIPSQTADSDMDLQRQVFERLSRKDLQVARDFAVRKMDFGVTPAVVAAYDMLRRHDAGMAKSFGAAIVSRLETMDPAHDPVAAESAFALQKLQRMENGGRESRVNLGASLLDAGSLTKLYEFIGDAFLDSQNSQALTLKEKPSAYMAALQQYVPEKAADLTQALAVSSKATAGTQSPQKSADQVDAEVLTPEEEKQVEAARSAIQARLAAQIKETSAHTKLFSARLGQSTLSGKERDDALFAVVEEANRSISLGRALAKDLEPEAFRNGELEFYGFGQLNGVVDSVSSILQRYALEHPSVAEDAASRLDGPEVQTEVELQIAIREMNRGEGFSGDREGQRHRMNDELRRPSL